MNFPTLSTIWALIEEKSCYFAQVDVREVVAVDAAGASELRRRAVAVAVATIGIGVGQRLAVVITR